MPEYMLYEMTGSWFWKLIVWFWTPNTAVPTELLLPYGLLGFDVAVE